MLTEKPWRCNFGRGIGERRCFQKITRPVSPEEERKSLSKVHVEMLFRVSSMRRAALLGVDVSNNSSCT